MLVGLSLVLSFPVRAQDAGLKQAPDNEANPGLQVRLAGKAPDSKIMLIAPGVYKAVVWQASGGGIMEFYDLAADPGAKVNLAGWDRGLFEVGWHGGRFKGEGKDCCLQHILAGKKDPGDACYDGCRDWPSMGHKALKVEGSLEVIENSPARVRIRAESYFTWWSRFADTDMPITALYTFYPSGRLAIQVRVRKVAGRPFLWSREYGPHLFLAAPRKTPELNPGFAFSTLKTADFADGFGGPAEALVLAASPKLPTTFMLTIPVAAEKIFDRHMHHDGRSVNWDRAGYGSPGISMQGGYDSTWACLIEMGTSAASAAPEMKTPAQALPHALQYRTPARVRGVDLASDSAGDFNHDGFNESEGCTVLQGPGPLALTYERGDGAGFAPAFKVLAWKGDAPRRVQVNGMPRQAVSAVVNGNLILQVLGRIENEKAELLIGK